MTFAPENTTSGSALVNQPFTATWGAYTPAQAVLNGGAQFAKFAAGLPTPAPNSATNPSGTITAALDPKFRSTYIEQFNLTVEREFSGFVGSVSYVGQLGRRLAYYLSDYNTLAPNSFIYANPNDTTSNTPALSSAIDPKYNVPYSVSYNYYRRFAGTVPNVTSILYYTSSGISNYHAMQAVLKRRFSRGLDLQLGYTWARLLDDAESISNNGGNGFGSSAELIPTIDYGNGNPRCPSAGHGHLQLCPALRREQAWLHRRLWSKDGRRTVWLCGTPACHSPSPIPSTEAVRVPTPATAIAPT